MNERKLSNFCTAMLVFSILVRFAGAISTQARTLRVVIDPAKGVIVTVPGPHRRGWARPERDAYYVFSVKDAREITDIEGNGVFDPGYENHPGLEWLR